MAFQNLIGRRRRHDVNDDVPLLAEKLRVNVFLLQLKRLYHIFHQRLIEMNVNISNEYNISDV